MCVFMCVYLPVGRENCDGYCENGGTCVAGGTCVCSEGWTGDHCTDCKEGNESGGREAEIEAGVELQREQATALGGDGGV